MAVSLGSVKSPGAGDGEGALYMRGAAPGIDFAKLADVTLVVDNQELPVHSHILARESKVIFDLCFAQSEGHIQAAKRRRLSDGGGTAGTAPASAGGEGGGVRLEEPFRDYSLADVTLLLTAAYDPAYAAGLLRDAAANGSWAQLEQVLRLADFLEAPRVVAAVDQALCAAYPPGCEDVQEWMPILALADKHAVQLPASHARGVRLAVAALSRTVGDFGKAAAPGQRYLSHPGTQRLSAATCNAVAQGFLSCTHTRLHAIRAGRPLSLAAIDLACQSCNIGLAQHKGSFAYTWTWRPGYGVKDPQAKSESDSEEFIAFGLKWQAFAYLNGFQPENNGWLSLYLRALPSSSEGRPARQVSYRFTVKGSPDAAWQGSALVAENGAGFPRMMPTADLEDPAKGYMRDGTITILVELSNLRNVDI